MRSLTLAVAALCLLGAASAYYPPGTPTTVDKKFLIKQTKIYQLLWHVEQPLMFPELRDLARSFQLEKHEGHFKKPGVVRTFRMYLAHGYFQKRGERFSIYTESGKRQMKALVDLLYFAKDFDTFFKSAVWAREYLNEDLFLIAIYVIVNLRLDLSGIVMPALYEATPRRYFNTGVIYDAYRAALEGKTYNKKHPYVIPVNYNCSYTSSADNVMAYHTEDVSLLALRDAIRYRYPFWAKPEDYDRPKDTRRGDLGYFVLKIRMSHLYLQRLSNHLPDVEPINYREPICGVEYNQLIANITLTHTRLRDAVDKGYVFDSSWTKYSLRDPDASEIFIRLLEGSADSINIDYYGTFFYFLQNYGQQYIDCCNQYTVGKCGLSRPDSILSAPVFYRVVKLTMLLADYFKDSLGPYSHKELWLPGVTVKSLTFDKLVTFFEDFDVQVNNAVPVHNLDVSRKLAVVARTRRLNHKPFSYRVQVHSDRDMDVVVRVWIAPSCDVYGRELSLNEKRRYMFFLDSFSCKLQKGKNELVRNSKQFVRRKVPLDFETLIRTTEALLANKTHPSIDAFYRDVGFTSHLALPRGHAGGMKITTAVMITQLNPDETSWTKPGPDDNTYFPWDRPMDAIKIHTVPNIHFGEEKVFHSKSDEWKSDEAVAA